MLNDDSGEARQEKKNLALLLVLLGVAVLLFCLTIVKFGNANGA